ncbi:MAG: hypothetical protein AB7H80_14210 [Candidatus Kapaibacterium sp.]
MELQREQINQLATLLSAELTTNDSEYVLRIGGGERGPAIVLSISFLQSQSIILSAQTSYGYFELHGVTRMILVEPDEVIFVTEDGEKISGLVVGRNGACSLFANVERALISADLSTLEPALLLAAMQLGLTEVVPS